MNATHYIGLDVHKKSVSYCIKLADGTIVAEGKVASRREDLRQWAKQLPQPWEAAMEATLFSGWIYDTLKPYAAKLEMAHPRMLEAITAAKKKSDGIDAGKLSDLLRANLLPSCYVATPEIRELRRRLRYRNLVVSEAVRMKNRISGLADGNRSGVQPTAATREGLFRRTDGEPGGSARVGTATVAAEPGSAGDVRGDTVRIGEGIAHQCGIGQAGGAAGDYTGGGRSDGADVGVGDRRSESVSIDRAGAELLRADGGAEQFGRQAETRTDQQAAQSSSADGADRSGQTGATLEPGVGSGVRAGVGAGRSQSGDAGSGSEAGGLPTGGRPLRT